jgi:hypothetical protein
MAVRAISCVPNGWGKGLAAMSPNRKRHIARVVIWSIAAAALVAELGFLALGRLA